MRTRAQQTVLEILAKSIVYRERDDQGSDSSRDPGDGNAGDDPNDGLATFGTKVARGYEEFETHRSHQLSAISSQPNWIIASASENIGAPHPIFVAQ
jgi:hypothetical protein